MALPPPVPVSSLLLASPLPSISPVRARHCPGCHRAAQLWDARDVCECPELPQDPFPAPSCRGEDEEKAPWCSLGGEHFPASPLWKVNEPATARPFIKWMWARGISWGHGALSHPAQAGHGGRHSPLPGPAGTDGLWLCTHLAHTPAPRANPEVFYPLYICLRKFKSKFGPCL